MFKHLVPALLLLLVGAPLVSACSHSCETLADETCTRLGENTDECKRIRARADSATTDDRRVCAQALAVTRRLTPKN